MTKINSTRQTTIPYLWHLLSDFGQVLPFLANDETVKPGRSRDGGDRKTVGLGKPGNKPVGLQSPGFVNTKPGGSPGLRDR